MADRTANMSCCSLWIWRFSIRLDWFFNYGFLSVFCEWKWFEGVVRNGKQECFSDFVI